MVLHVIAGVMFFASPLLWVLPRCGPKWREEMRVRVEKHTAEKAARIQRAQRKTGETIEKVMNFR